MTNIEIIKEWIEALRSDKYKQGRGHLCKEEDGAQFHCCLGVLCDILGLKKIFHGHPFNYFAFDNEIDFLPKKVVDELGFDNNAVIFNHNDLEVSLSHLNDSLFSFKKLANCIEKDILPKLIEKETCFESLNIS